MAILKTLDGNQLAKLLNQLDANGEENAAIIVETEMDFRYEVGYKNQLLDNNK